MRREQSFCVVESRKASYRVRERSLSVVRCRGNFRVIRREARNAFAGETKYFNCLLSSQVVLGALTYMGTQQMEGPIPRLDGLRKVRPQRISSVIRLLWPEIKAARELGHTLKFIHEHLVESGLAITYNQLTVYVSRINRKQSAAPTEKPKASLDALERKGEVVKSEPRGDDPLANYHESCIRNPPPGLDIKIGKPDISKLV